MPPTGLVDSLVSRFQEAFGRPPSLLVRAPGRINLLGAHVDYSEGWVLPAAIDRSVWLAAALAPHHRATLFSADFGETAVVDLDTLQARPRVSHWSNYASAVAWSLRASGYALAGMDAALMSDLPMAAGLSSSAALEMALVLAWQKLCGLDLDPLGRARLGQQAENEYLGVGSGIMDQFASVFGRKQHFLLLDCRTLEHAYVPISPATAVILADSGARRQLADIDYNARPKECREAVSILSASLPGIRTLRDVSAKDFDRFSGTLPAVLRRRARHVIEENVRVHAGVKALTRGNLPEFGRLVGESQESSRSNYENSTPELDLLGTAAQAVPGYYGARFAGGGFGGMMQLLVDASAVPAIVKVTKEAFEKAFRRPLVTLVCHIAGGAEATWL